MVFNRDKLKESIRPSIHRVYDAYTENTDIYRNTLDCFSAAIEIAVAELDMNSWYKQEKLRQQQKTMQNAIGTLHELALSSLKGVELNTGGIFDIISHERKILAEIKNKHNTTKGNHKIQIYRDLESALAEHVGYTAYYVEILPAKARSYNVPFTPSDNVKKTKASSREDIRMIDGRSFYHLLTGDERALDKLYSMLPELVKEIVHEKYGKELKIDGIVQDPLFVENFRRAYGERL